jgi:Mg2+/Co2+ transporter CorB
MILDFESRDVSDVMIHKYRIIILVSYNIRCSGSVMT